MDFGDRIRGFFSRRNNPALRDLEGFVRERKGVEGYIEPQTATSPTTLLVVDRDGDHLRAPVRTPEDASAFCERLSVPVYDAAVIGYPKRMREFERRRRAPEGPALDDEIADLERRLAETDPNTPNN
jgi:hypothetical protein